MKKLLMITMALLSSTLFAAQDVEKVNFEAYCSKGNIVSNMLEKFGERPFINFKSQRDVNNETVYVTAILFVNPKDSSWSWIEKIADDYYCVIATGDRMMPHGQK